VTSPRLPPVSPRSPAASTADAASSSQTGAIAGSAAASGQRHSLPPPPVSPAIRPHLHVDAPQATPSTPHHTPLQRQAQAVATALNRFRMSLSVLNEQQRQALYRAAIVLPPHPPGTTEASRREEQLHAVLLSISGIEGKASEDPGTGDEAAAHGDGGVQDSQGLAPPAQVQAVDAIQQAHGTDAAKNKKRKQSMDRLPYTLIHANAHWNHSKRANEFEPLMQADSQSLALPAPVQTVDAIQEPPGTSADQGGKQPMDMLPYSIIQATDHWNRGMRTKDFEPLKQALEKRIGKPVSGGTFLQLLSQACDKAKPEERKLIGELNEEKIKGSIFEFKVRIHRDMEVVHVWRGAYDNGYIDLRRAPKKIEAYPNLLEKMKTAAKVSAVRRSKQHTPYSAKEAWTHWNYKERAAEFEPLLQAWQKATEKTPKQKHGPAFLRYLSEECDKAEEGGELIEHLGKHGEILEFKVQTHEGAIPQRVWRGVDGNGHVNLRLAPEEGNSEARKTLLGEMKRFMQKASSGVRIERLPGGFVYSNKHAQNHWQYSNRVKEFEPLRQALEKAMDEKVSGPVFLQLLSQACDKAKPEDCKHIAELNEENVQGRSIFEFKVQLHRKMEVMYVWRRIGDNGYIDLRLAPENSDRADQLLKEIWQYARTSSSQRSKRPTLGRFRFSLNFHRHWLGQRATELEPLRQAWQEATEKSGKQANGPAFLKHLLTECSKASDKAELRYDLGEHAKIYEFEVQTHPEGREERFWCWIDGADCITSLRKAPEKGNADAYEKLKAEMTTVARGASSRWGGSANDHIDVANIVKPEPATLAGAFPAPVAGVEAIRLNTAQLHHVPTTSYAMIDLTAGDGSTQTVFTVRHADEAIVSTGKQTYDPTLDKIFPIRAPAHPDQVHPDYADPDDPSRCAPQVALKGIHFYKGGTSLSEQTLWQRAKTNFKNDFPYQSKKLFIEALKRSCEEELKATMQGRQPPSSRHVRIDLITEENQCDSPEEFTALHNQYGGFLTDYAPSSQPSLRNARIVCLFAGSRLSSHEDDQHYFAQFGQRFGQQALQDYAANVQQYGKQSQLTWAPYGGGNMGQYFNSTFKPGSEGKLQVDVDKTNALLCPVIVELTDRHGKARKESMLMIIQDRPIVEGKQIKLDYGNDYVLDAKKAAPPMSSHPVKQEIPEGQAEAGGSMFTEIT